MTVITSSASSGPYTPNGATTVFAFSFDARTTAEVKVVSRDVNSVDTVLTGYTVALTLPGGTVTFLVAPAAGDPIYVLSNPSLLQQIDFAGQGQISATALNEGFDRGVIRDLDINRRLGDLIAGVGGSGIAWGAVGGTLANQTDLITALNAKEGVLATGTTGQYLSGDKTWQTLDKGAVGLGNVDNTSDLAKPVSTATQAALDSLPGVTGGTFTGSIFATNLTGTNTGDQTITLTGDVTGTGSGSFGTAIALGAVTLSKMAQLSANTILGNNTGASAYPLALPGTSIVAMLPIFTTTANGLVPLSPGGSTNFLGADGVWRVPSVAVGSVAWGAITGTLSSQTDLNTSLAGKAALAGATFTGAVTATNLSGTNTGDQTITLTGDVTGTGTGSFAATIGANTVVFSKLVAASAASIVGATAAGNFAQLTPASAGSVLGLAAVATSGSATDLASGTLAVARGGTGATVTTGTGSNVLSASPTLTGAPVAPTAAAATNTTQLATTAFVQTAVAGGGSGSAPAFLNFVSISGNATLSDASHNNNVLKLTGSTAGTITAGSAPSTGFSCIIVNRGSVNKTFSCAGGVYLNAATTTVTSVTLAPGAHVTVIHEGAGVYSLDGAGAS